MINIPFDEQVDNIKNLYFKWLCDKINANYNNKSYVILLKTLHRKEYYWTVPNDDNRGSDGKMLREYFATMFNYYPYDALDGPCSMLEMLVALADRCNDIMDDPNKNNSSSYWFWVMMTNITLHNFDDEFYIGTNAGQHIDKLITKIIDRTYDSYGHGGLFPLKNTQKDQRKIELWYQMSEYLMENYFD